MKARGFCGIFGIAIFLCAPLMAGTAFASDPGDISPLSGGKDYCVSEDGSDGNGTPGACIDGAGLGNGVSGLAVTPDGTRLHSTGGPLGADPNGNSVSTFDRDGATGEIDYQPRLRACISDVGVAPCSTGGAGLLATPSSIAISPNGQNVYVTARQTGAISVFEYLALPDPLNLGPLQRTSCNSRTIDGICSEVRGLGSASDIVISPDGNHAYTAGNMSNVGGVAVLDRAADGSLKQKGFPDWENTDGCVNDNGNNSCIAGNHVEPIKLAISPDGKNLYAASQNNSGTNNAVDVFDINPDGTIEQKAGIAGCFSRNGSGGDCTPAPYLRQPTDISISPDGEYVYVTSDVAGNNGETDIGNIYIFGRNTDNGNLNSWKCFAAEGADACTETDGLYRPYGVLATNEAVYVTSLGRAGGPGGAGAKPGALVVLNRHPDDGGDLTQKPFDGCFAAGPLDQCAELPTLAGARSVATSPDGDSLYVGSGKADSQYGAITVFNRNDGIPPETTIDSGPQGEISATSASFTFSSDEPGTFECRMDGGTFAACSSPKEFTGLALGTHTFQVRAIDSAEDVDATPAERSFKVIEEITDPTCETDPSLCPDTKVDAVVTTAKLQKQKGKTIVVAVKIRAKEAVTAKLTGSVVKGKRKAAFKPATRKLNAGTTTTIKLQPAKAREGRLIAAALLGSRRAVPKVLITLTDGAMNRLVVKPKITIQGAPKMRRNPR